MKDIDLIKNSIDALGAISVPVGLLDSIGVPIYQVRKNLQALYEAVIEKSKSKNETEEPQTEEVTE